jgi:tetratricopeptide (TPR) repeat protein
MKESSNIYSRLSLYAALAVASVWILSKADATRDNLSLAPGQRLVIASFINTTDDPGLGDRLKAILSLVLEQSPSLTVYPDSRIQENLRRLRANVSAQITARTATDICLAEGIPFFLLPRVSRVADSLFMSIHFVLVGKGGNREILVDTVSAGDEGQLLASLNETGSRIRRALGEDPLMVEMTSHFLPDITAADTAALQSFSKAMVAYGKKDYQDARVLLNESVTLDPEFGLAHIRLARLYRNLGYHAAAMDHVKRAQANASELPPKENHAVLGVYYAMTRQYPLAQKEYETLTEIYPKDCDGHFELAKIFLALCDFPRALREFRKALQLDGSRADLYLGLSLAHLYENDSPSARKALERAQSLEPDNPNVVETRGLIELIDNNLGAAVAAFEDLAAAKGGVNSHGDFLLAQAQIYGGLFEAALATLASAIEVDKQRSDRSQEIDRRLARAQVFQLLGDTQQALDECAEAAKLDLDPVRLATLGAVYVKLGSLTEARALLKKVDSLALPESAYAETLRGEIERAAGHPEIAIQLLKRAKDLYPGDAASIALARALAEAGRSEESLREYEKVCARKMASLFPPDLPWFTGTWVQALRETGLLLNKLQRMDKANQYFRNYLWVMESANQDLPSIREAKELLRRSR